MQSGSCEFNIGRKQKRLRLIPALVLFTLTSLTAVFSVYSETRPVLRLIFFFPFWIAILGFIQAKERTCVFFAFKKIRVLDEGSEMITDPELARALIQKGQKITVYSALLAGLLAFFCYFAG